MKFQNKPPLIFLLASLLPGITFGAGVEETAAPQDVALGILVMGLILLSGLVMYFLPGIMASIRKCRATRQIWLINILLGWTFFGWIAALVMAVDGKRKQEDPHITP